MTLLEFLTLLLISGVCGSIGQALAGASRGGCLIAIALGFVGALLGAWLARVADLPEPFVVNIDDTSFPIVWSIVGSALFVAAISFLRGGAGKR